MDKVRVGIKYVDNSETEGYLQIFVNGIIQPSIRTTFEAGNEASIHMGLGKTIESVYKMAYEDGVRSTKSKMSEFLEWAKSP